MGRFSRWDYLSVVQGEELVSAHIPPEFQVISTSVFLSEVGAQHALSTLTKVFPCSEAQARARKFRADAAAKARAKTLLGRPVVRKSLSFPSLPASLQHSFPGAPTALVNCYCNAFRNFYLKTHFMCASGYRTPQTNR